MLVAGAFSSSAQNTTNFTPDPFVSQVTSSARDSFAGDMTANGRFVVIESSGDIATEKVATFNASGTPNPNARNNEDGNREIFLYDYAQRRSFQLTNTKSVLNPSAPDPVRVLQSVHLQQSVRRRRLFQRRRRSITAASRLRSATTDR
ncbi:MAG: hypothetical protein DMF76_21025 [Acidobacteria bacterium]|nr:MAG: hypothetical protein DMF76_21025 [Acidobacteriota bacterium]